MFRFALLLFVLLSSAAWSQTVFSTTDIDLGDLYKGSDLFDDILVSNRGKQKAYILRVEKPNEVVYRASSDVLFPDSSFSFRLQANPQGRGPFSYTVNVYTSDNDKPVAIRIHGTVKELPAAALAGMQSCPDFGTAPSRVEARELTIFTIDEYTRAPLIKSTVIIIRNGSPAGAWITGRKGSFTQESVPGYFYFFASHEGYLPKEAGVYVGPEISEITIPLRINPAQPLSPIIEPVPEAVPGLPEAIVETVVTSSLAEQMSSQRTDSVIRKELPELAALPPENFDADYFKPVNVVFVLDISSSMKMGDKMELMKYSLNQLITGLRAQDHMALVTYASDARVLLEPTSCDRKDEVRQKVAQLKPEGLTAGGAAIKLGYKQVLKQLSPDKANLVIIITDGAFNRASEDYQKVVSQYARKGIQFSVVGIQDKPRDEEKMREAAAFGNGRYVPIDKLSDAQFNLLQEIRIASFRKQL